MTIDYDNEAKRLERIDHMLEELRSKVEDFHALATLAQQRADRRVTETKTITNRALRRKKTRSEKDQIRNACH
jgi:hypothetical protein